MNYFHLLIPFVGALLGWLFHFIATRIFFRQILPKKKLVIAEKIGEAAALEFANFQGLEDKINDPKNLENILPMIESHIDVFLNEKLKKEMPVISMFVGTKTTDKLKEVFMKEIQNLFPQVIGRFASNLKEGIDIKSMIVKRIGSLKDADLGQMLETRLKKEIRYICIFGALTGFIIGLLTLLLTVLTA